VVFFIIGLLVAHVFGVLSLSYETWLPPHAGAEFLKYFMISVTIIVVAVPEGLAVSVTLSLAYSMRKMMAANNRVRKMHACETIGAATVICSDKTGTLTRNEMSVTAARFSFQPGETSLSETTAPNIQLILEAIGVKTTAQLGKNKEGGSQVLGNPTEGALLG
jgi:P-type Ca2+ transporter type 2C